MFGSSTGVMALRVFTEFLVGGTIAAVRGFVDALPVDVERTETA